MYTTRAYIRIQRPAFKSLTHHIRNHASSVAADYSPGGASEVSLVEIRSARAYCLDLLKKFDTPSYTLLPFIPSPSQTAYIALRTFNLELALIPDSVSTPQIGKLRLQFWRDNITSIFEGRPPKQPVAVLLHHALTSLRRRTEGKGIRGASLSKSWFMRIISAREKQFLENGGYVNLEAVERYAESTYSTLLYLTLQSLPLSSLTADHLASHVGKAAGIATVLRGIPLLAFPPPSNHHSNSSLGGVGLAQDALGAAHQRQRQGVVTLPLDIKVETGLKDEDVFRQGAAAPGLRDAVFKVATRASDHLITASSMLSRLRKGQDVGHEFEHEGEEGHIYPNPDSSINEDNSVYKDLNYLEKAAAQKQLSEWDQVRKAFPVLLGPYISTKLWLERLEKVDFDIFREELRRREWKLAWRAWWAHRKGYF
ncbi:MAG: hypothetical protein MMC33_006759 [Icmadophila ericetorum]|nr:hypothetical protein [Icmadophila ericetorum]